MHLLVTQSVSLDDIEQAVDLDQAPADIVALSFADTDLNLFAAAYRGMTAPPGLRLANLKLLRHPMSVDLYVEKTAARAGFVVARLLGGVDYWRYGVEQLATACRASGTRLALLPGDDRPDPRLAEYSTEPPEILDRLAAYCRASGPANYAAALTLIAQRIGRAIADPPPPAPLPAAGAYLPGRGAIPLSDALGDGARPTALILFYRSSLASADHAAIDALHAALAARGLQPLALFVTSLKDGAAQALAARAIDVSAPAIVLNLTAFAAGDGQAGSVLDRADRPVLQAIQTTGRVDDWRASPRGLGASDLVMNVILPESDGRLVTRAISAKAESAVDPALQFTALTAQPMADRIDFVADLARAWVALGAKPPADRRLALILSDYPDRGGRSGYAVGLDSAASTAAICGWLKDAGYRVDGTADDLMRRLATMAPIADLPADAYRAFLDAWPAAARDRLFETWGAPDDDPDWRDGAFRWPVLTLDHLAIALQPGRGGARKGGYHDLDLPPRHGYVAFYVWLRRVFGMDALIHLGTHGTLEWLPGKAMALDAASFPEAVLGPVPVIYPFIVSDPGEAAPAKRRLSAVTIGHLTPPLAVAGLHGAAAEIEAMFDEYAQADGMDRRRAANLGRAIVARARETGLAADCGIPPDADPEEALVRLDAWLCDLKEMAVGDGLHVFGQAPAGRPRAELLAALAEADADSSLRMAQTRDAGLEGRALDVRQRAALDHAAIDLLTGAASPPGPAVAAALDRIADRIAPRLDACADTERRALLTALDGRFVAAGPAGAPTRGRLDCLPTGRNLATLDPRALPTRTAALLGARAADEVLKRHLQDQGDWPRHIVIDLWAASTLRSGGEDLAQGLALMGVAPRWDTASHRVDGFDIVPAPKLDRPRVDVTLRISGSFRDAFPAQIALFAAAVRAVAALDEADADNPLAAARRAGASLDRVYGAAPGAYGVGVSALALDDGVADRDLLGRRYLDRSHWAYDGGEAIANPAAFAALIATAEAFVHGRDLPGRDALDGEETADHVGGFAAAAEALGAAPALYQLDTSRAEAARVRTLSEDLARAIDGRAVNPRWIAGQMRHGHRGAADLAQTVDGLYAFAVTARAVDSRHFDAVYRAYVLDPAVAEFLKRANPDAARAIAARLTQAWDNGLWRPTHNSVAAKLAELGAATW